ncbi:SEL1-like repeat protein [Helicobacter macacae]|uniref:Beta-lactamase n=1 Tax=Helicobacter macacae MIT 99-5501 TaxID=1357400 RepID=V8C537_9HELI|nr:sel1 repeat family protein [Helicobacter macacae]ETD22498.1 hypothetical protein HMPREF2086_01809 [Helicobacter macacae MIT 99-5501]
MKKVLLVFCVIVSINVANGKCPYFCHTYMSPTCEDAINECKKEDTVESLERAISFCKKLYHSCNHDDMSKLKKRKSELAAQQEQDRYAKCRNGNADACFDIGYEEFEKCNAFENCENPSEALTYFSKSCNLKHKVGCFNTAMILEQNLFFKNPTKAQEYYRKSCNMGYEPACFKVK